MSHLQTSLGLFEEIGSTDFLPEVYRHFAETYLERGEPEQALDSAQRSLILAQEQDMRLEEGMTRRVLGQVHLSLQDWPQAEDELQSSLEILEELGSRYEIGQTLLQLAILRRRQTRSSEADAALTSAIEIFDALGAQLDLEQAQAVLSDTSSSDSSVA